jgi:site-specific recombinase XerD
VDLLTNYSNYLKARRMAKSTQETYFSEFKAIREYFKGEDMRYISRDRIIEYLARLYDMGYSPSKVNQAINAYKFYREQILGKKRDTYYLKRPYQAKFNPTILSQEQMFAVVNSPKNLKHRTLLQTMYSNGLRRGELINLQLMDVRTKVEKPHIIIRNAKHNTSRHLYIDEDFVETLQTYYRLYKPKTYLFEGAEASSTISATTVARILDKALKTQGITERFRVHDLRHNFATHCLLNGTDIYDLSQFLGHKSVETTERYYAHLRPDQITIKRPKLLTEETKIMHLVRA